MFPILGSASLLLLFFAFQMLSDFLVLYLAVSSYAAVYACASGFLERSNLSAGVQSGSSTILALGLVVAWICTNHFLFIDGIGFCLCVTMISLLRLNSLRVGAIAGLVLFIYDTFWVFFSHLIFRENVMVKVATQQATNPVYNMATAANLPGATSLAENLELPIKFLFPVYTAEGVRFSMLGLGDVAIPGIFVCFCMRVDHYLNSKVHSLQAELRDLESATSLLAQEETVQATSQWSWRRYPYFTAALSGYAVGLMLAMLCVRIFHVAQVRRNPVQLLGSWVLGFLGSWFLDSSTP